ncbi:reverse transcriptase domain-containing protein [Pseudovibrio sp. Tun.PSC04-5.I4]|uniref:reverse transcriptase domain-containing protein n=1 Tax=Pseudovibrio sp. Tun.PSC04-5.I4 TaxID=1798213 RepID=UPI0013563EE3|nr:reverse transcriptase domain-containing protein [Pseudovibrio sp. Tun.PSC04-5.I4]
MHYVNEWQPYRTGSRSKPDKKSRNIRYAARRDAYIYAHYRKILIIKYEERLKQLGISDCPIAYRRIMKTGNAGKCNIDFAKEAFDRIDEIGDCVAIALDIRKFFENLNHAQIKEIWSDLLDVDYLPRDHFAVFKNLTQYRYVDQNEVYTRLGYIEKSIINGTARYKRAEKFKDYKDIPKQLCSPTDFRSKIAGQGAGFTSLISKNTLKVGIPQGTPISDLVANFYLLSFDKAMYSFAKEKNGYYYRYSDDILLILPGARDEAEEARIFALNAITEHGQSLEIKDAKTCIVKYERNRTGLSYEHLGGPQGKNGFEYLGFRFDGTNIYLRDATISRLFRKASATCRREAIRIIKNNPTIDKVALVEKFNISHVCKRYLKVESRELQLDDVKSWSFWTYVKRANQILGRKSDVIPKQINGFKTFLKDRVEAAVYKKK